ncbi:hypothetical protein KTH_52860 [Thermosporothrix hazakensis]|jgi:hypothetical protein|nr:hypothetical protein KTH_52860 [Thermosporothrix hazakensis]
MVSLFLSGVLTGTVSQREMPEGNFFGELASLFLKGSYCFSRSNGLPAGAKKQIEALLQDEGEEQS